MSITTAYFATIKHHKAAHILEENDLLAINAYTQYRLAINLRGHSLCQLDLLDIFGDSLYI